MDKEKVVLTYSMSLIQKEPGVFLVELPRKQILITQENEEYWKKIFTNSINEQAVQIPIKIVFKDKLKAFARFKQHDLLLEKK